MVLSIGAADGVKENDVGKLYEFNGQRSILAADLSSVKSNNTYSYWIVERVYENRNLKKGQVFQFEILNNEFKKRKFLKIRVTKSVRKDVLSDEELEELFNDPTFEEEIFQSEDTDEEEPISSEETIRRKQQGVYQKTQRADVNILESKFSNKIDTQQVKKEIIKKKFHKEVESFVNKFNNRGKGLAYNLDTGFDNRNIHMYPRTRNLDDPLWSKALDQNELREFLMSNAVTKEREYREIVVRRHYAHEIFMRYALALQQYTNGRDPRYQGKNVSTSFGYEYFLGRNFLNLERFSVSSFYTKGLSYFDLTTSHTILGNALNAQVEHSSFGAEVQYYLGNMPYSIEKFMFFVGIGSEIGSGTLNAGSSHKGFGCGLFSLLLNTGVKYRFKDFVKDKGSNFSLGWSLLFGHRRTSYSVDDQTNALRRESFDTTIQSSENKVYLGMSLYF